MVMIVHPIFGFWFLVTFGNEVTKIYENITESFTEFCKARWARRKKWKENHATKVTKIPKPKRRKYGMNETDVFTVLESSVSVFFSNLLIRGCSQTTLTR